MVTTEDSASGIIGDGFGSMGNIHSIMSSGYGDYPAPCYCCNSHSIGCCDCCKGMQQADVYEFQISGSTNPDLPDGYYRLRLIGVCSCVRETQWKENIGDEWLTVGSLYATQLNYYSWDNGTETYSADCDNILLWGLFLGGVSNPPPFYELALPTDADKNDFCVNGGTLTRTAYYSDIPATITLTSTGALLNCDCGCSICGFTTSSLNYVTITNATGAVADWFNDPFPITQVNEFIYTSGALCPAYIWTLDIKASCARPVPSDYYSGMTSDDGYSDGALCLSVKWATASVIGDDTGCPTPVAPVAATTHDSCAIEPSDGVTTITMDNLVCDAEGFVSVDFTVTSPDGTIEGTVTR